MSGYVTICVRFVAMAHIDHAMIDDYARTGIISCVLVLKVGYFIFKTLIFRQIACDVVTW
jgi:hypothetical protein